ncbi:hypothetical protein BFJ65_g14809 [Fusarium oxysporum f. sp. cepae]|uniref:Uncharacterized protein n=1 Tax=Fusarium oxysporum f. sp. cepae TaxID=396571 RepID=A0A3L6N362_FUSOX|nr:hypothetical protein BFJ65_g14809 [Fusarium oxysporum f. sp. cepae]
MVNLNERMNGPRFRDIEAWDAIKACDFEYAINLLVSGEWKLDDELKDSWGSLDARIGGERCHETALLALILRCIIITYLKEKALLEEFEELVIDYRTRHAQDKRWTKVFKVQDIYVEASDRYKHIIESVSNFIGPDWTTLIGSARTLASFSVLSTMDSGLTVRYRRMGDVLVATSEEQRAAGLGAYYDAEYPLRTTITHISFKLIETLSAQIMPKGAPQTDFGEWPWVCETLPEQAREMFHFSEAKKFHPRHKDCHIIVGSFSASMQILIRLCWLYKIPITLCMPRLRYEKPTDGAVSMVTYKLTSAPIQTYVTVDEVCGGFQLVDAIQECIGNDPCWKLGGYSMYHESQPGRLLSSGNDDEYIKALERADVVHLLSLYGFAHREYPPETKNGAFDLATLQSSICEGIVQPAESSLDGINSGQDNNLSLLSLSAACGKVASRHDLKDAVLAHQRNNQYDAIKKGCYQMQCKPIPFTFDHIDISTPSHEQAKWAAILKTHRDTTEPVYEHLFEIGNTIYSMSGKLEADRLMAIHNTRQKIKSLLQRHPNHEVFLTPNHKETYAALVKESEEKAVGKGFV